METRKQKAFLKISLLFLLFAALVAVVTAVSYRSLLKAFYPMEEFGTTQEILAAYHAGRGQVNRWLKDPGVSQDGKTLDSIPIPETAHYVKKVTNAMHRYQNLYHIGGTTS